MNGLIADRRLPLRRVAVGQPAGEGDTRDRAAAAVGHAPERDAAQHAAAAPPAQGARAARLDAHAAERAPPAVAGGRVPARARPPGARLVGRREDVPHHVLVHARLGVAHRLQADAGRLRVGLEEHGQGRQPQGLPAVALREGADAALGPLPRLLHGARQRRVELQLHGSSSIHCTHIDSLID